MINSRYYPIIAGNANAIRFRYSVCWLDRQYQELVSALYEDLPLCLINKQETLNLRGWVYTNIEERNRAALTQGE